MAGTLLRVDLERSNASELNDHLQSLLSVPGGGYDPSAFGRQIAPQPPPVQPAPTPAPTPPSSVTDELTSHLQTLTGGGLNLLGQGLTSLGQGAQNVQAELNNHLQSLLAPPPQNAAPAPQFDSQRDHGGSAMSPAGDTLQDYARQAATRAGVDPDLFVRQIQQESGFNPTAGSPAGARGIAQIVPKYHPGVDVTDPYASLDYAAKLMRSHLDKYGDYAKALAAYNAGAGAVDRYGGVPPFEETQRYVSTILQGSSGQTAPTPQAGLERAGAAIGGATRDISQFGDSQLTAAEAAAACGPASAVRFAQRFGRNPTLKEATDLARNVGWTEGAGMAGLGSEQRLLERMGVTTKMVSGAQWESFAREATTGNPVVISTPGHYFYADNYDPQSGRYHVGRSGLDLRGGSEWMTPEEMTARMGAVQGGLLADTPVVPNQSTVSTASVGFTTPSVTEAVGRGLQTIGQGITSLRGGFDQQAASTGESKPLQIIDSAVDAAARPATVPGQGYDPSNIRPAEPPQEGIPLKQDVRDLGLPSQPTIFEDPSQIPGILRGPGLTTDQEILDRASPEALEVGRQYAQLGGIKEPTDSDIANVLRSMQLGEAYAGTHTGAATKLADQAVAVSVNNMLSNPASLLMNATGGLLETAKRPAVTAATAGVELLTGRPSRALTELGAAGADLKAMGLAIGDALSNATKTVLTGRRLSSAADQPEVFEGAAGMVATPFLRVMGGTDELVHTLSSAGAQGAEVVRLMAANPKLSQAAVMQQFADEIMAAGQQAGAEAIFQTGGSGVGKALASARRGFTAPKTAGEFVKGAAAQVLTPFSVVPDVILMRGASRIPILNELLTVGKSAKAAAAGDMAGAKRQAASGILAGLTNFAIWTQVQQGNITGSGPDDPARRKALMNARDENGNPIWRPNSIRVGDQWVPYSSLGGVAVQLGAIANAVEQFEYTGRQVDPNYFGAMGKALTETITDAWYLQTVEGVFDAIRNNKVPEWMGQQALSTAGRAIPEAGLLNFLKGLTDPVQREPKLDDPSTWSEYFKARIPGLSEGIRPRIDPATGRPAEDPRALPSALVRSTATGAPSPANELLARHNLGVGDAPTTVTIGSGRNQVTIAITDDEQRRFQELAGPEIERSLTEFARDKEFATYPLKDRREMLQDAIRKAREQAGLELASQLSDAELDRRVAAYEESQRRQAEPSVRLR